MTCDHCGHTTEYAKFIVSYPFFVTPIKSVLFGEKEISGRKKTLLVCKECYDKWDAWIEEYFKD